MIKSIDFPNREFATKEELFKCLKEHKDELIALKKSEKHSVGVSFVTAEKSETIKSLSMDDGYIYPVINTTKYMDSHRDVHIDGLWNKSVKEQQGKIFYIVDHDLKIPSVIAYPKDVEMLIESMTWKELGASYSGNTQALIFKVAKSAIRLPYVTSLIEEKIDVEHSVRMQYVTLFLCINSEEQGYKEEKANFDAYYPYVVNKEEADEVGYFWAVTEGKIYKEGSMVLAGSNDITPLLQKDTEAVLDTSKTEPLENTQPSKTKYLI